MQESPILILSEILALGRFEIEKYFERLNLSIFVKYKLRFFKLFSNRFLHILVFSHTTQRFFCKYREKLEFHVLRFPDYIVWSNTETRRNLQVVATSCWL